MEILISVAIFSIGILAVLSMQLSSINANSSARKVTDNYVLAAQRIEDFLAMQYNDPALAVTGGWVSDLDDVAAGNQDGIDNDGDGVIDEDGETGYLTIQWNIEEVDLNNLKRIRVNVAAADRVRNKEVTLEAFKTSF